MTATLKDVAAHAGVSIKTVSNVVNDRPFISQDTRQRVQLAIAHLGYQPNLVARHMRKARVGVIAFAIPDLTNTYFSDLGNAIIAAAAEHSFTVLVDHTNGDYANESLLVNGLRPHLIDGIILSPNALELGDLQNESVTVPIVLLGERLFGAPCDHVVIDNVAAAREATAHLLALGRRRVAFIGASTMLEKPSMASPALLRLRGFTDAHIIAGLDVDQRLIIATTDAHLANGVSAVRELLALDRPPDAIFCFNDLLALGAQRALHEAGLHMPDDIAICGFDDLEISRYATPSLTTVAPDKRAIGHLAVNLLLDRIHGRRTGPPEQITPPFQLVVRESTVGVEIPGQRGTLYAAQTADSRERR